MVGAYNRYGQANPGNVGPTRKVVVTAGRDAPAGADKGGIPVVESGSGPMVTAVHNDPGKNRLIVSRGGPTESLALSTMRFGEVMHDISHIANPTSIPTVEHWAEFDANGDPIPAQTILLPDSFAHADGFGPSDPWVGLLPAGLGWIRLGVGSEPLGESRWDADVIDEYVEPADAGDAPKKPTLLRAYIEATTITLVFNVPVRAPDRLYQQQLNRFRLLSNKSSKVNITAAADGTSDHLINLTISQAPTADERLSIGVDVGAVKSRTVPGWAASGSFTGASCRASASKPVIQRVPKACYVLAINRAYDGETLTAESKVILSTCVVIRDTDGIEWPVYDAQPLAQGGGGDVATMAFLPSSVVQRQIEAPVDHFYTPPFLPTGDPLDPVSWADFDLPITFLHGDPLPVEGLPTQIGWVRMRYPSENKFGTNGKAGEDKDYGSEADPTVVTYLIRAELKGGTELTLWFNEKTGKRPGVPPFTKIQLNERMTVTHSVIGGPTIEVESVVAGDKANKYVVTLSGATPAQWNTIASSGGFKVSLLEVPASLDPTIFVSTGAYPLGFIANNIQSDFAGVFGDDRAAYLLVLNRVHDEIITIGSSVNVSLKSYVDIPEEADPTETRRIYDFSPGMRSAVPHFYEILYGNIIDEIGGVDGIRWLSALPDPLQLPNAWEQYLDEGPQWVIDTAVVLDDGFGIAMDLESGRLTWYCHFTGTSSARRAPNIWNGLVVWSPLVLTIPIVGTSPTKYITFRIAAGTTL